MAEKIQREDGTEIEVYSADEVKAQADAAVAKASEEFKKTEADLKAENERINGILNTRSGEFGKFRELHADVVAKLGVAERTIYENQLAQKKADDERAEREKKDNEARVDSAIRAKVGTD